MLASIEPKSTTRHPSSGPDTAQYMLVRSGVAAVLAWHAASEIFGATTSAHPQPFRNNERQCYHWGPEPPIWALLAMASRPNTHERAGPREATRA